MFVKEMDDVSSVCITNVCFYKINMRSFQGSKLNPDYLSFIVSLLVAHDHRYILTLLIIFFETL